MPAAWRDFLKGNILYKQVSGQFADRHLTEKNMDKKLFIGLFFSFIAATIIGTLSHEFGHYFAAVFHKTEVSLPYFLPFPSFLGLAPFGTLGAVIRLKGQSRERNALFDIAASGPIAGFVVSLALVYWGFATLPDKSFLYQIHPEYSTLTSVPSGGLTFGYSLAFYILEMVVPSPNSFILLSVLKSRQNTSAASATSFSASSLASV